VSPPGELTQPLHRARILIVLLGAIGDVVRAMPLAMRLRRGLPEAHLAWAVEPTAAPLLEAHPSIDQRLVFRRDLGALAFLRFLREVKTDLVGEIVFFAFATGPARELHVSLGFMTR